MHQERILAVHDVSCVGRCSLTVALPIISSVGIECSVLPTAVLSTHTGGFTGFTYRDLTEDIVPIQEHWRSLGLRFGAVYTGFLGSFEQIDLVCSLIDSVSDDGTTVYVDPVMADKGKLYSVFGPDFPKGMRGLCEKADVIMPNLTELTLMLGEDYSDGPYTHEYIDGIIERSRVFGVRKIIITGVSFCDGSVGAVYMDYETGDKGEVMRPEIPGYYHGTGDVFGSALVGACESGLPLGKAVEAAVDLTVGSIIRTHDAGTDVRYGVNFEAGLYDYVTTVRNANRGFELVPATTDEQLRIITSIGHTVWNEAYHGLVSQDQIDYMLNKFQSFEAMKEQIAHKGYTYLCMTVDGKIVGYAGYAPDDRGLYLSKMYILKEHRGKGYAMKTFAHLRDVARSLGLRCVHLTVKRNNESSFNIYKHAGFEVVDSVDNPIGDGFVMYDYIMEMKV